MMKKWLVSCLATFGFAAGAYAEIELQGSLQQGGLIWATVAPSSSVSLDGKSLHIADNGLFVAGFDRDAGPVSVLKICNSTGECAEQQLDIVQRSYDVQRVNGVPQKTVTPPASVLERIRREGALVSKARSEFSARQDFIKEFKWPLLGPITGVFGSQRVYNGSPGRPHYGLDIAAPTGTLVSAPIGGVVTLAYPDMFYSGGTLIIDHGLGVSSTFIHLSRILVEEGQLVKQGDPIAEVGATGRATGPHLDWRINWADRRLDPALIIGPMPEH
ncbi:M23 family metallopeptidase [Zhongshania marina]|uniref:Peptidase n=1 Tax=Zhongshania marina TaxID=2304603 RepID=A0A2S4HBV2_9GAMM|nr:M23 family metallopeptidase [Marortus luteolus]POP51465.1 peptidase [Marortus luteolus]